MEHPWLLFRPAEGQWYRWQLNGGLVHLCRTGKEWRYAVRAKTRQELDPVCDGPVSVDAPQNPAVSIAISGGESVSLRPTMINKPVVIEALNSMHILGNQELQLVVDLPVSVHFELDSGETLCQLNTFQLLRTWFGDTSSGTLCFSWPLHLEPVSVGRAIGKGQFASMLRCRILIRNLSRNMLELKQFAVYTEMLDIWELDGQLRTDTVLLEGLSDGGLKMGTIPDPESRTGTRLYQSELGQTEMLVKRGVSFLRSITGIT